MAVPAISSTVSTLAAQINFLEARANQLAEVGDVDGLAFGLDDVRRIRKALSDLERHVEDLLVKVMPTDRYEIEGALVCEKHYGRDRKHWDSEELLRRLVGDQLVNPETGENVIDILRACIPFTKSLQWRVKGLRGNGINPDEWCDSSPGRTTVSIRSGDDRG